MARYTSREAHSLFSSLNQFQMRNLKLLSRNFLNFDFKFQVFLSRQDRKTNSSVSFLGEVTAQLTFSKDIHLVFKFC